MQTSRRRLSRKRHRWSYRIWTGGREVELASSDGEHADRCYAAITWHSDGGPSEWVEPVPTISDSTDLR